MRPYEEDAIDKMQPKAAYLKSGMKEILFKEVYEHIGIGGGHVGAHDLEVMLGVKGEALPSYIKNNHHSLDTI
jgi:hypothetical protein